MPVSRAARLAALPALLLLLAAGGGAAASVVPRLLTCPPSIIGSVLSCSDGGTVMAAHNVTYSFVTAGGDTAEFDLVISLHTQAGDADLVVLTPARSQLVSMHGSGEDVVFIPRSDVLPGEYLVTVAGSSEQSSYKLTVEKHERQRSLATADRAVMEEILHSQCCARPGSCATLRATLAPAGQPSSKSGSKSSSSGGSGDSQASGGGGGSGSGGQAPADLCNTGRNLCDVEGHLVHLALVNEYMSCPFPAALGRLPRLTLLDLTMNDLTGYLHREVAAVVRQLPSLENLLLAHNRLGGRLSCELVAGPLAELEVAANQVEGTIPACIVQSPSMQELYLANNLLSGALPQPPPGSRLLIISAHSNSLTGSVPDVSALHQLQALVLHDNQLSGAVPALPRALLHINLESNSLSGSIPEQWGSLEGLEVVRLRHNQLTGSLPPGLARQTGLELLLVGHNRLGAALPEQWGTPQLQRLELQGNAFTGPLPAALGALPALTIMQAGQNQLSGSLEAFAQAAAEGSQLEVLSLEGNQFDGPVPQAMQRLPLFAEGARFTMLDGLSVPATLNLGSNQLSGAFPAWAVQALGRSNAAVNLGGNRLDCPAEIAVPAQLPEGRLVGLECIAADGSTHDIADFVRVTPAARPDAQQAQHEKQAPAEQPEPELAGDEAAQQAAGDKGSAADDHPHSSSSDEGVAAGVHHWAPVLAAATVVAALAAFAGPRICARLKASTGGQYQPVLPLSRHPSCASPLASPGIWAKEQQLALLDQGQQLHTLPRKQAPRRGGGAWGACGSGSSSPGGASPAGPAMAAEGPFSIGTRVHRPEADQV